MEHEFTVKAGEAGDRLDKFLCRKLPKLSRKQIKSLLDGGRVSVDRRRVVIAGWELTEEDRVEVRVPPGFHERSEFKEREEVERPGKDRRSHLEHDDSEKIGSSIDRHLERQKKRRMSAPKTEGNRGRKGKGRGDRKSGERKGDERRRGENREPTGRLEDQRVKVYYQDRDIIVVEKPAGILAVARDGARNKDSLQRRIQAFLKRKFKGSKHSFVSPLHRLDVETSGIMVYALSKAGQKLTNQFKNHSIERTYQAIVAGQIERESGVIDKPVEKGDFGHGRKVRPSSEGKRAVTEYTVKERYGDATFLIVRVRTGRTHQIRVHLASENHPVIGDHLYADGKLKVLAGEMGFKRHALHAHSLGFKHPVTGNKIFYRSPIPDDMKALIDKLRESS